MKSLSARAETGYFLGFADSVVAANPHANNYT
jgi:hypothetical protein